MLWRMCIVWGKTRSACALAIALLVVNVGLNIVDVVLVIRGLVIFRGLPGTLSGTLSPYRQSRVGVVTAFLAVLVASNLCATSLVGLKAWYVDEILSLKLLVCFAVRGPGYIEGHFLRTSGRPTDAHRCSASWNS